MKMIIAIISPIKFKSEILKQYVELSLEGDIVLLPVDVNDHTSNADYIRDEAKHEILMELHKKKIDIADKVLVLNVGGYMGRGTYEEIGYAVTKGKEVEYLEELDI